MEMVLLRGHNICFHLELRKILSELSLLPLLNFLSCRICAPLTKLLLQIRGKDFKMTKLPLETCRQFYFEDLALRETTLDPSDHDIAKKTEAYCQERVESLLDKAGEFFAYHSCVTVPKVREGVKGHMDFCGFNNTSIAVCQFLVCTIS